MLDGRLIRVGYDNIGPRNEVEIKLARFQVQRRRHLLAIASILRGSVDV